ncbi:hypothetical protein [Duganella sp. BuS-21]|uniref:hypothetical protein n=1 Tax=Duganella sp. BuS-21 TaxID=2943848 RepID=UPI0035A6B04F
MKKLICVHFSIIAIAMCLSGCGGGNPYQESNDPKIILNDTPVAIKNYLGEPYWKDESASNGGGNPIDGVGCLLNENYHIHSHLSIFYNGTRLAIPKNIGLKGCAYEIHTHDNSGIIHIETDKEKKFSLGQFFSVWGKSLLSTEVAGVHGIPIKVYVVDENSMMEVETNWAGIEFTPHRSISIVIGTPPAKLPSYSWPTGL